MRIFKALFYCLLAAAIPGRALAQTSAGGESFEFLLLDANARAVALGGAYTALAADANALLYNPAGLARVKTHEATFMHNQYLQGLTQEYLAMAAASGWGAGFNFFDFGSMDRTTLSHQSGGIGEFGLSNMALSAGYGRNYGPLSLGGGLKYIREATDNVTAAGCAADLGAMYDIQRYPGLTLGAALQNMGPAVKFIGKREKLPFLMRGGMAYSFKAFNSRSVAALDVSKAGSDKLRFGAGSEILLNNVIALRAGFTTRNDAGIGLTAGAGWQWKSGSIDYALVPFGDLGLTHRISLNYRWGGAGAKPEIKKPAVKPVPSEKPGPAAPQKPKNRSKKPAFKPVGKTAPADE